MACAIGQMSVNKAINPTQFTTRFLCTRGAHHRTKTAPQTGRVIAALCTLKCWALIINEAEYILRSNLWINLVRNY